MISTILFVAGTMAPAKFASLPTLKVVGNKIVDNRNRSVRLRGVNTAVLEWSSDGDGQIVETIRVATQEWKSNHVRIPLSQDRWFGKAPEQIDGGKAYRALVRQAVDAANKNGAYAMLDLHWNNAGEWGKNIGQHVMPDMLSLEFWTSCAKEYKNHAGVIFDLYNEPHDTTWDIWLKGGTITETRGVGARQGRFVPVKYETPGMQKMLDTVRATGAKNVIVAGGLDWSYDLSGFLNGYQLKDPKGNGVIYACHAYPFKGDTVDQWLVKLDKALPVIPVVVSEFGDQPPGANANKPSPWIERVLAEMEKRKVNWTAWDLHPGAGPCLISDWKFTPTPQFGVPVKNLLTTTPHL